MTTESTVQAVGLKQDRICPYCNHQMSTELFDGVPCPRCGGEVYIRPTPSGFRPLITRLHKHLLAQQWPPYLTREQCLRIAGVYQLGTAALGREIRLGARHDAEAALMLLASVASRRVTMGNAGKEKALQQLTLMGGKMGFPLPNSGACDVVGAT